MFLIITKTIMFSLLAIEQIDHLEDQSLIETS